MRYKFAVVLSEDVTRERQVVELTAETYEQGYTAALDACPEGWSLDRVTVESR